MDDLTQACVQRNRGKLLINLADVIGENSTPEDHAPVLDLSAVQGAQVMIRRTSLSNQKADSLPPWWWEQVCRHLTEVEQDTVGVHKWMSMYGPDPPAFCPSSLFRVWTHCAALRTGLEGLCETQPGHLVQWCVDVSRAHFGIEPGLDRLTLSYLFSASWSATAPDVSGKYCIASTLDLTWNSLFGLSGHQRAHWALHKTTCCPAAW